MLNKNSKMAFDHKFWKESPWIKTAKAWVCHQVHDFLENYTLLVKNHIPVHFIMWVFRAAR